MKLTSRWVRGIVAAALAALGTGAALGAGAPAQWHGAAADAGLRLYAWTYELLRQLPLVLLLPIIAVTVSYRSGSRLGTKIPRQPDSAAAARPALLYYAVLFGMTALMGFLLAAARSLGR